MPNSEIICPTFQHLFPTFKIYFQLFRTYAQVLKEMPNLLYLCPTFTVYAQLPKKSNTKKPKGIPSGQEISSNKPWSKQVFICSIFVSFENLISIKSSLSWMISPCPKTRCLTIFPRVKSSCFRIAFGL